MFIVILFIFFGIALGYTIRTRVASSACKSAVGAWGARITTWLLWLLLFLLGIEVGSNQQIIASLPTLGVEALVLSVLATLGSCVMAWVLWKTMKGGEKQ